MALVYLDASFFGPDGNLYEKPHEGNLVEVPDYLLKRDDQGRYIYLPKSARVASGDDVEAEKERFSKKATKDTIFGLDRQKEKRDALARGDKLPSFDETKDEPVDHEDRIDKLLGGAQAAEEEDDDDDLEDDDDENDLGKTAADQFNEAEAQADDAMAASKARAEEIKKKRLANLAKARAAKKGRK